jgi:hypothetical protein
MPQTRSQYSQNRAIGRELAHAGDVEDRLARPCVRVAPEGTDLALAVDVGGVIGQQQERVVPKEAIDQRAEQARVAATKRAGVSRFALANARQSSKFQIRFGNGETAKNL